MEHSRLLKFLLPESVTNKMAEPVKIKFDYQSPANVEAEVPGAQKIREAPFELDDNGELLPNGETGEITPNNAENNAENYAEINAEEQPVSGSFSSYTEVTEVVDDGVVTTRHRQVFSGKRNGIHGEPVMMEDKMEDKKARTKIPVSRFKQTVEKVTADRRGSREKKEHESNIPVRRSSIPKPLNQKTPATVKKEITLTKIETRKVSEPIITKTEVRNEFADVITKEATKEIEPEDEFDKIYEDLVVNTPTEVILDDSLLNPKVEDPEKLESKFEEIVHDYDEHKVEPIDVEVVRRSKIPYLKRKSQQEVQLSAQAERTSKIIAARDKLRLRHSSHKDDNFEDELDKELKNTDVNNEKAKEKDAPSDVKTEKQFKHEVISSPSSRTENEIEHEVTTLPDSKVEVTRQFTKTVSTSSTNETENVDSTSVVETTIVKEVKTNESNDKRENKQHFMTEENIEKGSIRIGIPVFDSYVHEFSEKNETAKTIEVKTVLSYIQSEDLSIASKVFKTNKEFTETKIGIADNKIERQVSKPDEISEHNNYKSIIVDNLNATSTTEDEKLIKTQDKDDEVLLRGKVERIISKIDSKEVMETENNKRESINDYKVERQVSKADEISERNNEKSIVVDNSESTLKTEDEKLIKTRVKEDEVLIRGKVERIISKIDSKEVIETEKNKRESINELTKKKSVLSKIAMFERKEAAPVLTRAPKKETRLPKLISKDWQKDHVHIHTPLIVDEVFKPFQADIDFNNKVNKEETPLKRDELSTIVRAERVTVESSDTVHYAAENKIQIESKAIVQERQVIEEAIPVQARKDSEYCVNTVEIATITDIQPSKGATVNDNTESKDLEKENKVNKTERATRLSVTKELQAPVVIPGFKPVSELLRSFESKKESNRILPKRTISKVEFTSTVIETPVKMPEVIQPNEIKTSVTENSYIEGYHAESYDDFDSINDYKSLDDVFSKESEFNKRWRVEDDMRRAKSLAELDVGDAVKGKVNNIILRMKSVDRIELDRKEMINKKEMPRKRSVSEKIALFEGKLTPSRAETALPLRIFKTEKPAEARTEKIENIQTRLVTLTATGNHSKAEVREKSVTERSETGKTDEEVIQKKIQDLTNARIKYGRVETVQTIELSNGIAMPVLAIGTALLDPQLIFHIVTAAIDLGYRAIDTAYIYGNENIVGDAIRAKIADGTVKRKDLFIMSKLWSTYHRTDLVEGACRASLTAMGLQYFDLYMIHNPMSFKEGGGPLPKIATVLQYSESDYLDAWYGMEGLVTKGLVKSIGVSNFNSVQIQRVLDKGRVKPVVNQVECHPYLSQHRLDLFCSERNIFLSCFGVLGSKGTPAEMKNGQVAAIDDALVQVMASGLGISPAQLLISYQLENNHTVVVKSSSAERLWSNLQAVSVSLTSAQVDALSALNRNKRTFTFKGMGDTHKNYPFNIPF